jgi:hypothetical protein
LGRFAPHQTGRVLLYAAEDPLHVVRERLDGIALARELLLERLDIHVVTVPTLRLDLELDCQRLIETVALLQPKLLVLDPFVRLHRCDENASGEVAPLLAFLRQVQRRWRAAIAVVHHAKKGGGRMRPGQALRGSSEFHAWGDSNLYLRREGNGDQRIVLGFEHRAASSPEPIEIALLGDDDSLALQPVDKRVDSAATTPSAEDRIIEALRNAAAPMTITDLRARCKMRTQRTCDAVAELAALGRISKWNGRWSLNDE